MVGRSLLSSKQWTKISILLTIVALLLWSHSILYAKLEIGYFGLIHGLPITFFVALALLTAASTILWTAKENHGRLLCLQLVIFVAALWLVPVLTGGSHPFTDETYTKFAQVSYIVEEGGFSSQQVWYLSWPGAQILLATLAELGSIDYEPLTTLLISFTGLLFLPPLYLFLRNVVGQGQNNYHWAGLWLFSAADWAGTVSVSPQGIGFFLLLTLLALITTPAIWKTDFKSLGLLSLVIIVFAALVITHLLTSLAVLCILAVLCLVKRSKRLAIVLLLCLLLLVSWDLTGGAHYIGLIAEPGAAPAELGILILDPGVITEREVTGHFSGSESHIAVAQTRILLSSIFVLLGLVGALLLLVKKRNVRVGVPLLAITLAPLVLLPLSGHYTEELLRRLYLFALPGMAYFGAMLLDVKNRIPAIILCLLIIIGSPLNVISHYGNQELDYFSLGRAAGLEFFNSTTSHGYVTGGYPLGRTKGFLNYLSIDFDQLRWQENELVTETEEEMPHYIVISRRDRAQYEWFEGNDQFITEIEKSLDSAVNCNLIYNNPILKLYVCDDPSRLTEN